ncbi:MAG: lipoprotein releasing system transmembrane-like protein, partial [Nitrospinae bacterium RIFCSPLOWO2_12_FULL_47_7]
HDLPHSEKAEVLLVQGQMFPHRRLYPVQLRGVEMEQTLLNLPLDNLRSRSSEIGSAIPVVLGINMARNAHLKKGDTVILKWRDRFGAADAREVYIMDAADFLNPRIDEGIVWLRLDHLREMTRRPNAASWVAVKNYRGDLQGMEFLSVAKLMEDLLNLLAHDRRNSKILWAILMFLAGISVFNTQIMSIFKRQKEIGMFMAMGMLPRQIIGIFVLEGGYTALCAVLTACLFGFPFFIWFQGVGFDISHLSESTIPVRERIFPAFNFMEIFYAVSVVVGVIIASAWLPVRKISHMDPTRALRGKAIV